MPISRNDAGPTGGTSLAEELATLARRGDELLVQNGRLNEQLKALSTTEAKLHAIQNDLDHQLKIFSKLHELGVRVIRQPNVAEIAAQFVNFILYELGFERGLFFLDQARTGTYSLIAFDGYYGGSWAERLQSLSIDETHPLAVILRQSGKVTFTEQNPISELIPLAAQLDIAELLAFPLSRSESALLGMMVTGNSAGQRDNYVSVLDRNSQSGMANLSTHATSAIQNALSLAALQDERNLLEQRVTARTSELAAALASLRDLDIAKSQFFANVSHELRTPLTLSIGPLEGILHKREIMSDADRERHLKVVYSNQLRLLKLINNLLDFAKIDAGKMTARFQVMNVVEAARYYVGTVASASEARGIALTFETDADDVPLYLDRDKFENIVMNLLSNAFKFTPDGGRIAIRLFSRVADVELQVSDSGIGISKEAIPALFQRFTQLDASERRKYEGTGIGLAMVKEYVALHGAEISVESELGVGTTFAVKFRRGRQHLADDVVISMAESEEPRTMSAYQLADLRSERDEGDDGSLSGVGATIDGEIVAESVAFGESSVEIVAGETDGATILVVDDVADMRKFIADVLKERYRVRWARDGQEGLEMARRFRPELIVSDVMMPRMTGYELCAAIRGSQSAFARTPIVLLSAKGELAGKLAGLEHGADDYLVKPFNADELHSRVRNLLRLRLQERQLATAERRAVEAERKALQTEMDLARDVQVSILPTCPTFCDDRRSLAGFLDSASACSGDFWMYRLLPDGRLFICLGDVTGHGLRSAMMTELVCGALKAILRSAKNVGVGEILTELNATIDIDSPLWMTMAACLVDHDAKTLEWASAAHPPILYLDAHETLTCLQAGGAPLGQSVHTHYEAKRIAIGSAARLLIYSDGLTEAENPKGRAFSLRRLVDVFSRSSREPTKSIEAIRQQIAVFVGRANFDDDVTAIAVTLSPVSEMA